MKVPFYNLVELGQLKSGNYKCDEKKDGIWNWSYNAQQPDWTSISILVSFTPIIAGFE